MSDTAAQPDAVDWATGALDLDAYLRRTGYDGELAATGQTLAGLHRAHVAAIPFENASIMLGRGVAVDLPSIQDKLVRHRRGGYCFEHGLLLAAVLERLGYQVNRFTARVGGDHDARTHLVLRVQAGRQSWLADTGFGTGLIEPLPFGDETPRDQYGWAYRLAAAGPHLWRLQERRDGSWVTRYRFDDQPQYPADITMANHFTATYPQSHFVRQLVVIRKDTGGLRMLTGRRLSITRPGHPASDRQLGDADFASALTEVFGLQLDADESARLSTVTAKPPCSPSPG